jgi:hypothetical protein
MRWPRSVSHSTSRTSTPRRMSSMRSKRISLAVARSNGSSSTKRRMIEPSVAFTIVWPVRARP